jgi:hypothetical protein
MRIVLRVLVVLIGVAACDLGVTNLNNPDRDRLLRTPGDVEALVGQLYQNFHNATIGGSNTALNPQLLVSGMESFSGLGNFEMGVRAAIPRNIPHVPNGRGNSGEAGNLRDFQRLSTTSRAAADVLRRQAASGFSFGSPDRDQRGKAFSQFALGVALGHLAMVYDSAAIVGPTDDPEAIPPLRGYKDVMTAALGWLDSARATVNANPTQFGSLSSTPPWIRGNTPDAQTFVRIIRSYKARMRAAEARSDTAVVDWNAVIGDAENGITADLNIDMNPAAGWNMVWVEQQYLFGAWHQMWQFMVGFADTSGGFDAWLAKPIENREPFPVVTPDLRFPRGVTRAEQQANSPAVPPAGQYFRNRREGDSQGNPLGFSNYDFYRFQAFRDAQRIGNYPVMTVAEMNLLRAEGHIRLNEVAQAGPLIDFSRVTRGGLPAVTGIADLTTPVPGGASCVPRVPQGPNYSSSACGNIFEAMKWEKRMETAFIGYGSWYFDSRRWGDLPAGTALHWPVPWQEMDARSQPFYHMPSAGTLAGAPRGKYGL